MIYCDASLLVALTAFERFSAEAEAWFDGNGPGDLACSGWSDVEIASALARKQRSRVLDAGGRAAAASRWRNLATRLTMLAVEPDDFASAATLVDAGPRGLRSGDALHLAIVMRAGHALATLDRDLADAAEAVGVEVALRPPA